jgi:energy-coupling factor transporter ATP-binding protein EcfA2
MRVSITNFRGVSRAEIDAKGVTLIAGQNGMGKTSVLQAIAAASTGTIMPIDGMNKNQAAMLVHAGTAAGEVVLDNAVGAVRVTYPDAKRTTSGIPVETTDMSAGLHSIADDDAKVRARIVSVLLKAEPAREDLSSELAKINGTPELVERVWQTIAAQGWDAAHAQAKEKGTRMKGAWEQETGERYGTKKSEAWIPKEWEGDLQSLTVAQLTEVVKQETEWLEAAISDSAVNAAEVSRLRALAADLGTLRAELQTFVAQRNGLATTQQQIRAGLAKLPPAIQPETVPCPHCGGDLAVSGGLVTVPAVLTAEELAERARAIADCEQSLKDVDAAIAQSASEVAALTSNVNSANLAAEALQKLTAKPVAEGEHASVEDCRARVLRAQNRLAARQKWERASTLHASIGQNAKINEILAPDGLRLTKLNAALSGFNSMAALHCQAAAWRPVEIRPDMSISYGGSPYAMLSESEQFRVRIILQVAFAALSGDMLLLIDRADLLDKQGRNGLFRLLASLDKTCVVGMTIDKDKEGIPMVPDMSRIGGVAYYLDKGVATQC